MFKKWKMKRFEENLKKAETRRNLSFEIENKYNSVKRIADTGERYIALNNLKTEISGHISSIGRIPVERITIYPFLLIVDAISAGIDDTTYRFLGPVFSKKNADLGKALRRYKKSVKKDIAQCQKYDSDIEGILKSPHYHDIASQYPEMRKAFIKYAEKNGRVKPPAKAPVSPEAQKSEPPQKLEL